MDSWHPFAAADARVLDPVALRTQLAEDGYLFLPGLLDREAVLRVRRDLAETLASLGWLAEASDPMDAHPSPKAVREAFNADYFVAYQAIQSLQSFHELAHHPRLVAAAEAVIGEEILVHPRKIARVNPPGEPTKITPPHQDYRLIQGTADVLTIWLPLGDCPHELGGLATLTGSHREGLRPVELLADVAGGVKAVGVELDPADPRWVSSVMTAGDVLLFHSLTVHAAKPNLTDRLRLSADFRYQSVRQPVVADTLEPHYRNPLPGYAELTRGWTDTRCVAAPDGLRVVEPFNPLDPDIATPPSELFGVFA